MAWSIATNYVDSRHRISVHYAGCSFYFDDYSIFLAIAYTPWDSLLLKGLIHKGSITYAERILVGCWAPGFSVQPAVLACIMSILSMLSCKGRNCNTLVSFNGYFGLKSLYWNGLGLIALWVLEVCCHGCLLICLLIRLFHHCGFGLLQIVSAAAPPSFPPAVFFHLAYYCLSKFWFWTFIFLKFLIGNDVSTWNHLLILYSSGLQCCISCSHGSDLLIARIISGRLAAHFRVVVNHTYSHCLYYNPASNGFVLLLFFCWGADIILDLLICCSTLICYMFCGNLGWDFADIPSNGWFLNPECMRTELFALRTAIEHLLVAVFFIAVILLIGISHLYTNISLQEWNCVIFFYISLAVSGFASHDQQVWSLSRDYYCASAGIVELDYGE